jgi:hypothetical protein
MIFFIDSTIYIYIVIAGKANDETGLGQEQITIRVVRYAFSRNLLLCIM